LIARLHHLTARLAVQGGDQADAAGVVRLHRIDGARRQHRGAAFLEARDERVADSDQVLLVISLIVRSFPQPALTRGAAADPCRM
jgi:hypothetical protein